MKNIYFFEYYKLANTVVYNYRTHYLNNLKQFKILLHNVQDAENKLRNLNYYAS